MPGAAGRTPGARTAESSFGTKIGTMAIEGTEAPSAQAAPRTRGTETSTGAPLDLHTFN